MGPVRSWYAETIRLSNAISSGSAWYHVSCSGASTSATRRSPIAKVSTTKVRELDAENVAFKLQLTEMYNELKLLQVKLAQSDSAQNDTLDGPAARERSDAQHPPIRGSASCPTLTEHFQVAEAAEESQALPATGGPTPPPKNRPKVNRKPPAHTPDFPEIRFTFQRRCQSRRCRVFLQRGNSTSKAAGSSRPSTRKISRAPGNSYESARLLLTSLLEYADPCRSKVEVLQGSPSAQVASPSCPFTQPQSDQVGLRESGTWR